MNEAYSQLCSDLVKWHQQQQVVEKRMEKERMIQGGTLTEAKQTELDQTKRIYERILACVTALAESLFLDVPVLEVSFY